MLRVLQVARGKAGVCCGCCGCCGLLGVLGVLQVQWVTGLLGVLQVPLPLWVLFRGTRYCGYWVLEALGIGGTGCWGYWVLVLDLAHWLPLSFTAGEADDTEVCPSPDAPLAFPTWHVISLWQPARVVALSAYGKPLIELPA